MCEVHTVCRLIPHETVVPGDQAQALWSKLFSLIVSFVDVKEMDHFDLIIYLVKSTCQHLMTSGLSNDLFMTLNFAVFLFYSLDSDIHDSVEVVANLLFK